MEILVSGRSSSKVAWVEALAPIMVRDLGLSRSNGAIYIVLEDRDDGNEGSTTDLRSITDTIVISIRPYDNPDRIGVTLAHELVHAAQFLRGQLRHGSHGSNYWMGRRYKKSHAYLDSPWEIAAFSKQELLYRRALRTITGKE